MAFRWMDGLLERLVFYIRIVFSINGVTERNNELKEVRIDGGDGCGSRGW
jgi:hypothetical protein